MHQRVNLRASVLWITKQAKPREKHETLSRLSPPFVLFVIQTLHHRYLLLRQPIQPVHNLVNELNPWASRGAPSTLGERGLLRQLPEVNWCIQEELLLSSPTPRPTYTPYQDILVSQGYEVLDTISASEGSDVMLGLD